MKKGGLILLGLVGVGLAVAAAGDASAAPAKPTTPAWWPPGAGPFPATAPPGWPPGYAWPPDPNAPPPPGFPVVAPSSPGAAPGAAPGGLPPMPQGFPQFPPGFDPSQYIPGGAPGAPPATPPSAPQPGAPPMPTCALDQNLPPDIKARVQAALSTYEYAPPDQLSSLADMLDASGFPLAAGCLRQRAMTGQPINGV